MKKIISIIAVLLIVAVFASGCGSDKGTTANNQRPNEAVASEMPTVEPGQDEQPITDPVGQPVSVDLAHYIGEGDYALFSCAYLDDKEEQSYRCLGFYADGTVISVDILSPTEYVEVMRKVATWFSADSDHSKGTYSIINGNITFFTAGEGNVATVVVDYAGQLPDSDGRFVLNSYSHSNGHRATRVYEYVGRVGDEVIEFDESFLVSHK